MLSGFDARKGCAQGLQGEDVGALLGVPQWTATPNLTELGALWGGKDAPPGFIPLQNSYQKVWINNAPCALAESEPQVIT